jgi:hypothetical protein
MSFSEHFCLAFHIFDASWNPTAWELAEKFDCNTEFGEVAYFLDMDWVA